MACQLLQVPPTPPAAASNAQLGTACQKVCEQKKAIAPQRPLPDGTNFIYQLLEQLAAPATQSVHWQLIPFYALPPIRALCCCLLAIPPSADEIKRLADGLP